MEINGLKRVCRVHGLCRTGAFQVHMLNIWETSGPDPEQGVTIPIQTGPTLRDHRFITVDYLTQKLVVQVTLLVWLLTAMVCRQWVPVLSLL